MKICSSCENNSVIVNKITEESIIKGKIKSPLPPSLVGIRKRNPKNCDTYSELSLGKKYGDRWIHFWASNKSIDYEIKNFNKAYGKNLVNQGITKSDGNGKVVFKLNCPQPYKVRGKIFYPHIHFRISDEKNEKWEENIRTVIVVCNISVKEVEEAVNKRSYLILDALPKEYYNQDHIPNAINLYFRKAEEMSEKQMDKFVMKNLKNLNEEIQQLVRNGKLSIKDIPIMVYCYNEKCDAGRSLARRLLDLHYHRVVNFEDGVQGYYKKFH